MSNLLVWLDKYDSYVLVGSLTQDPKNPSEASFAYDPAYFKDEHSFAISCSLPLHSEPFSLETTRNFFSALMPDGKFRKSFASANHISINDFVSYLSLLNNETIGSLIFTEENKFPDTHPAYEPFTEKDFNEFANHPLQKASENSTRSRLSLAGSMAKIGLYKSSDGSWYLPSGTAPSTHIIKAGFEYNNLSINEAICLTVSQKLGLSDFNFELIPVSNFGPLLAIERFDRYFPSSPEYIDGLARPGRIHQEDFCQALNLHEDFKYETKDMNYLLDIKELLEEQTFTPLVEKDKFIKQLMFDFLIGNCDNHLKNYSIIFNTALNSKELSPHYDAVSTTYYALDPCMGIPLSDNRSIETVSRQSLQTRIIDFCGSSEYYLEIFDSFRLQIPDLVSDASKHFCNDGFVWAKDTGEYLINNFKRRMEQFDLNSQDSHSPIGDDGSSRPQRQKE